MTAVALLVAALTTAAPFDEALERATAAYREAEFETALRELTAAEPLADSDARKVRLFVLQGIVLANVPNLDAASTTWEKALTLDSESTLPFAVSTKVRAEFERVQRAVQRIKTSLTRPTPASGPVVEAAPPVADTPKPLPMARLVVSGVLLGLGAIGGGTGAGLGLNANTQYQRAVSTMYADDKRAAYAAAQTSASWANVSFVTSGVFVAAAVLTYFLWPTAQN